MVCSAAADALPLICTFLAVPNLSGEQTSSAFALLFANFESLMLILLYKDSSASKPPYRMLYDTKAARVPEEQQQHRAIVFLCHQLLPPLSASSRCFVPGLLFGRARVIFRRGWRARNLPKVIAFAQKSRFSTNVRENHPNCVPIASISTQIDQEHIN